MTDQTIECPKCNYVIPLSEALNNQIRQQLQAEVDQRGREQDARLKMEREALEERAKELKQQEGAVEDQVKLRLKEASDQLSADARRKAEEEFSSKLEAATSELEEKKTRIKEFQKQELALARDREALQEQRNALELEKQRQREAIRAELDAEYQKKQAAALTQAREESAKQAREQSELQLKQATEALEEKSRKVAELQGQELALRKEKQQLEEAKGQLELDVQRKLDEERAGIIESAKKAATEEQRLKERGLQDKISKLSEQLSDAQRHIEQGSQESQGEVLEEEMIDSLRAAFPIDLFEDVKKGARGADVLQTVRDAYGKPCGRILWESKNSKNYDKKWIDKLKSDQQECGAEAAVLLTRTLPTGTEQFVWSDDVWVTDFKSSACLCIALRQMLISVGRERTIATHQDGLKEIVYSYVTGQEFAGRVKMIYRAYQSMQVDLDSEKRAMLRIWKKREKQIALVLDNVAGMRGELEGIVGSQKILPAFEPLSLEALGDEEDELDS